MLAGLCPRCGTYLQPGNHFCPSCGAAVTVTSSPSSTPVYVPGKPLPPLPPKRRLPSSGALIFLGVCLFILFCCSYTIFKTIVAINPSMLLSARGTCQITKSQVQVTRYSDRNRNNQLNMKAVFEYTFATPDGHSVQGHNYDWVDDVIVDEAPGNAQVMVGQYHVGHSYPCWYNPLFPSLSALKHDPDINTLLVDSWHTVFPFKVGMIILTLTLLLGMPVLVLSPWIWRSRR